MLQDNNVGQIPVLFKTHKHVFGTTTSTLVALSPCLVVSKIHCLQNGILKYQVQKEAHTFWLQQWCLLDTSFPKASTSQLHCPFTQNKTIHINKASAKYNKRHHLCLSKTSKIQRRMHAVSVKKQNNHYMKIREGDYVLAACRPLPIAAPKYRCNHQSAHCLLSMHPVTLTIFT